MKAILVIDMPGCCAECPFCVSTYCVPNAKEMGIGMIHIGRLGECPLKSMPDRKEEGYPNDDYTIGKADGWNACIDAILEPNMGYNKCIEEIEE